MQEEEAKKILHDIILSAVNTSSFSESLVFLRNKKAEYIDLIRKESFPIMMSASLAEGSYCDVLNITIGDQRIKFIDLASKMNIDVLKKADKKIVIGKLNETCEKNNIDFKVDENNFEETVKSIGRIILLEKSKKIMRVTEYWEEFLEILPYCSRYVNMIYEEVAAEVSELVYTHADLKVLILVPNDAKRRAIEALTKAGHPKDMLETKTAGMLMTIVERMVTAGNAVMKCRKINPKNNPSKGQLIDQIAAYWFEEEDLAMQNKTDYIIPLPE
jgi:hypothetical protein